MAMPLDLPAARGSRRDEDGRALLAGLLRRLGRRRETSGSAPLLIGDPSLAWLVGEGRVDLFLTELREGRPFGNRIFLCTASQDDLVFGMDGRGGMREFGVLAVGTVGTVLAELPVAQFRALAGQPGHRAAAAAMIERWVAALSGPAAEALPVPPGLRRLVPPGGAAETTANERLTAEAGVGWFSLAGRQALFLDSAVLPDGGEAPFPLCPATWAAVGNGGLAACHDTLAVLEDGQLWPGLDAFHMAVLEVLPFLLRLGAIDEMNRLNRRREDEASALARAEASLAAVVVAPGRQLPGEDGWAGTPDRNGGLLAALGVVAAEMHVTLRIPPNPDMPLDLEEILRASNLRKREVRLEAGWWRSEVTPLLLPHGPDGSAAAALRRGGRLVLVGADGVPRRLSRQEASRLAGPAYVLYEPLPDRPLAFAFLLARSWRISRREVVAAVALSVAAGLLSLLLPLASGYVVDDVVPRRDQPALAEVAAILGAVALLQFVLRLAAQRAMLRLEGIAGTRMQAAIMDRVLRLPAGFFRAYSAGELSVRALALKRCVDAFMGGVMGLLMGGSGFATSLAVMAWASPDLTLVGLAAVAVLATASAALGLRQHRHEKALAALRGRIAGRVLEMMNGIVKLRMAAAENRAYLRWVELYGRFARHTSATRKMEGETGLVMAALTHLALAALFLVVAQSGMVEAGFGLGSLVMFLAAYNQAFAGASQAASSAMLLGSLKPSLDEASPILAATPERSIGSASPGRLSGAIEIGAVHFAYGPDAPPVLSGLSVAVRAGEFVALVGPSGSGKSTIIRLLLGFEAPQRGAILYDGKDLRSLDLRAVRAQMGVVLQRARLFGVSLQDSILGASPQLGIGAAWEAAEAAGIAGDIRAMPMGMATVLVEGGLSGGQLQRVMIARALVHRPRILLLDEATSALDNRTQAHIAETLARLSATRIVIAHRLSTVMAADRILVIRDGAVAESGSYAELMAAGGPFAAIADRQLA